MEGEKSRLFWVTKPYDAYGNALGYAFHNRMMYEYTRKYFFDDISSDLYLHIVSADHFVPIEGKKNILFTMWEFLDVPISYQLQLQKADYVIVPSTFCKEIFRQYCKYQPFVCHEGVDPDIYQFKERELPKSGERFRFLWVGASNPRKGYLSVIQAAKLADKYKNIEFYFKTTTKKTTLTETLRNIRRNWKDIVYGNDGKFVGLIRTLRRMPSPFNAEKVFCYGHNKNVFVDTRKLSPSDLLDLYYSAHCFLFPSLGEGWGLPLSEAMATGCPCIATADTGTADFFDDDVGFVIRSEIQKHPNINYGQKECRMYIPDTNDFVRKIFEVMLNYDLAKEKAKKASNRIRNKFTWKNAGRRLADIIKMIEDIERKNKS